MRLLLAVLALLSFSTVALAQKTKKPETAPMNPIVTIEMAKGTIKIELFPKDAPKTVENFITLIKKGFYNGLTFHRVVPNFVAQGGDPDGTGGGGPGYTIPDEKTPTHKHDVGAISMAKTAAPNSAGSQFYIVIGRPAYHLDDMGFTVFGHVIAGQDVAEKIAVGDKMIKVTVQEPEAAAPVMTDKPAQLVKASIPKLPDVTLKATDKATVTARFSVGADGRVSVSLTQGSGNAEVDSALVAGLARWQWQSAVKGGKAVESVVEMAIELSLRQER